MKPDPLPKAFPGQPKIVFTDVDETLTWQGRLPEETFSALAKLQRAGIRVVPVTGASAGWCDCMIRTWPIDSIIGENGSFYIDRDADGRLSYTYALEESVRAANWQTLQQLQGEVLKKFPFAHQTADQAFRTTDIAFDINQDRRVDREDAFTIAQYCRDAGMVAKISSIHINVWRGAYNKASTAGLWMTARGFDNADAIFSGDSPNDDAMFSSFRQTVGVANVLPYIDELDSPPMYVTAQPGGYGFAELAAALLSE
ncbi:MAG: HAD-IIB family hydrolase [Gammaproteobacteria bacterium]|nr:HAD-IIB family hydrolase [Gammaproteobacteria bacterium]